MSFKVTINIIIAFSPKII